MYTPVPPLISDPAEIRRLLREADDAVAQFRDHVAGLYADEIAALKESHACEYCACPFTLWHGVGRRGCRGHPKIFEDGRWLCCGKGFCRPGDNTGCVPCDHRVPGEETTPSLEQLESAYRVACSPLDMRTRLTLAADILGPRRVAPTSAFGMPLLVFALLPHRDRRPVMRIEHRQDSVMAEQARQRETSDLRQLFRPFVSQDAATFKAEHLVHYTVFVTRMDAIKND